jgi:GNAT superfamily N-acetyltransferase
MQAGAVELRVASDAAHYEAARALIEEYAGTLGVDLQFQGLAEELEPLPLIYGEPTGTLILAGDYRGWLGCGALRSWSGDICEMKRLYVRPHARGARVGRRLAVALIDAARALKYGRMRLDTLAPMVAARRLYDSLGFRAVAALLRQPARGSPLYGAHAWGGGRLRQGRAHRGRDVHCALQKRAPDPSAGVYLTLTARRPRPTIRGSI